MTDEEFTALLAALSPEDRQLVLAKIDELYAAEQERRRNLSGGCVGGSETPLSVIS